MVACERMSRVSVLMVISWSSLTCFSVRSCIGGLLPLSRRSSESRSSSDVAAHVRSLAGGCGGHGTAAHHFCCWQAFRSDRDIQGIVGEQPIVALLDLRLAPFRGD